MAKSDLLKEAIADAKAVKETALANAKIALEEAFAPRIQSMLSTKLAEDEMAEEEMGDPVEEAEMDLEAELGDAGMDDMGADDMGDDMGDMGGQPDSVMVGVDLDSDGTYDIEGELGAGDDMDAEAEMDDMGDEMAPEGDMLEDDLELESIIRELEEDLEEEMDDTNEADMYAESVNEEMDEDPKESAHKKNEEMKDDKKVDEDINIDEIIEAILSEEDDDEKMPTESRGGKPKTLNAQDEEPGNDNPKEGRDKEVKEALEEELTEAYDTINSLRYTINEVNLLNAKLLYTNKLFRNFELNENQKMKVIENFDRAGNTREVKLVFSTLAESFHVPVKKRVMVKESYASKPVETTAPNTKTKQIINEGNELANRWKKLAGLLD